METLQVKLARVQSAIAKLESSTVSSYEIEGRKITYSNISILYKREKELIEQIREYGPNYVPGSEKKVKRRSYVSFK